MRWYRPEAGFEEIILGTLRGEPTFSIPPALGIVM
jgi:hypothetical protein